MIRFLNTQPKGVSEIAHHGCELWVECSDDIGVYGYLGLQFMDADCSIHFEVTRFSGVVLKRMIKDWEEVKKEMVHRGIKNVIATNWETGSGHWSRFIGYFGFGEPRRCLVSQLAIGGK